MPKQKLDLHPYAPKNNLSIPNLISLVRLALIPCFIWTYLHGQPGWTVGLVIFSGLTDILDGYIARRFNQVTELGKVLDPLADKLTQISLAVLLCISFAAIIPLVAILVIKEGYMAWLGLRMIKRGGNVVSAKWWGKLATGAFYVGVVLVLLFSDRLGPWGVAIISLVISLLMLFSLVRYSRLYRRLTQEAEEQAAKQA